MARPAARWLKAALMAGALGILGTAAQAAGTDAYSQEAVKAAYLYRFAGYIHWPATAPSDAPFVIAVLGSPETARELKKLVPDHRINDRTVQILEVRNATDVRSPQILYVGKGRAGDLRRALPSGLPATLVVTDEEDGLNAGGAVNFLIVDRRVRFEVSLTAADRSGLKISSELLEVAVRVQGGGRQSRDRCGPFPMPEGFIGACGPQLAGEPRSRAAIDPA